MKFIRKIFQKNKCKVSQIMPDVNEKQNVFTDEDKAECRELSAYIGKVIQKLDAGEISETDARELVRQWERGTQI